MTGLYDIQKDVERILTYSQNYPFDLNAREMIKQWYEAKEPIINLFGGKTIIRSASPIKVVLSEERRSRRFNDFVKQLQDNELLTEELENFLLINKNGFFKNKVILPYPSKGVQMGSKLSKSLRKFIPTEERTRWAQDTISRFIQEDKIEGYLYLSVDPKDFLTISDNNADWWSCHSLDGDYRTGNLSYMVDKTTIVAYLANDKKECLRCFPKDMKWNSKKWRMLIHTDRENCIYYSRQYPYESSSLLEEVHSFITSLLPYEFTQPREDGIHSFVDNEERTESFFYNKLYPFRSRVFDMRDIVDAKDYRGYSDLILSNVYAPIVAVNRDKVDNMGPLIKTKEGEEECVHSLFDIKIGGQIICPCCGEHIVQRENSFLCDYCIAVNDADEDFYLSCSDCYKRIYDDEEIFYRDGKSYCKKCYNKLKENDDG